MDVVANYAAGEDAVKAFFSHESDKGKAPADNDDEGPSRGSQKINNKKKKTRQNKHEALDDDFVVTVKCKKPRGPQRGQSLTRCSKNPTLTTR